jgi:DHA2 family multidrug resistance protein
MKHKLLFILIILTIFSVLFNFAVISASVVYILSDLGSSQVTASYATVFYGVGNVLTIPLALAFKERIPIKNYFAVCQIGFIIATFLSGQAATYPLFIFFRFLQGASSGPLFILLTSFLGSLLSDDWKKTMTQCTLLSFITAPILGGSWGGWIAYDYNWRNIFEINVIFMCILGIALYLQLRKFSNPLEKTRFDGIGYTTFAIGFFLFAFFLTLGQELDWFRSNLLATCFPLSLIFLTFFVIWSLYHPNPLLDFRLLKDLLVPIALINIWVLFAIYFGMTLLLSIWLTLYVRYTVIWVAALLGVMVFSAGILMHVMRNYLGSHKVWIPFGTGILLLAISTFYTSNFNIDIDFKRIVFSRFIAGFAFALLLPSLLHLITHNKPPEIVPKLLTLFQIVRSTSSTLGVTIFYTIWLRRQVFFYERLGGSLTKFSPLTKNYYTQAKTLGLTKSERTPMLQELLTNEATSLALNDCFYLMGLMTLFLFLIFLVTFFKRKSLYTALK